MADIFGYFDEPSATSPAFDPGLEVPCPVCLRPCNEAKMTTISLWHPSDDRSYFFRAHKDCWEAAPEDDKARIESSLIDSRAAPESDHG